MNEPNKIRFTLEVVTPQGDTISKMGTLLKHPNTEEEVEELEAQLQSLTSSTVRGLVALGKMK